MSKLHYCIKVMLCRLFKLFCSPKNNVTLTKMIVNVGGVRSHNSSTFDEAPSQFPEQK